MRRILDWLTHPVSIVLLFALYGFMVIVVMGEAATTFASYAGTLEPLDLQLAYTVPDVVALFEVLGAEGREAYMRIETRADVLYPISYGLLLSLGTIYFFKKSFAHIPQLAYLGVFGIISMLIDFVENALIVGLLKSYPTLTESDVAMASSCTTLKWGFAIIALLLLSAAMIVYLAKKFVFRKI